MSDWQVGDLAVCVDDGPHPDVPDGRGVLMIVKGEVHRIAALSTFMGELQAVLFGVNSGLDTQGGGYGVWRFRKLNDSNDDAGLIERIKNCRPVKVGESA